jgi:hypothetical protein
MRKLLTILLLAIATTVSAQSAEISVDEEMTHFDSVRSEYVQLVRHEFGIWPLMKQRRLEFSLDDAPQREKRLLYRSSKPNSLGVGMYIFEVVLELTVAIPVGERNKEIYGDSKSRDFQLNVFAKKWGLESYTQKYEGFYVHDRDLDIPSGTPYPQRPDIVTKNGGVIGHYVVNNKKFSYRSTYNFADRQIRSAGSLMAFGAFNRFTTQGDSAIIGERYTDYFGTDAQIVEFNATSVGVAPGYSHNFVHKNFFLNAAVGLGPAFNWLYYRSDNGSNKRQSTLTPFFVGRVSIGYNAKRLFGGVSYVAQGNRVKFETINLLSSSGTFKVLIGYRFKEFGILKHRISEVPKLLGIGD